MTTNADPIIIPALSDNPLLQLARLQSAGKLFKFYVVADRCFVLDADAFFEDPSNKDRWCACVCRNLRDAVTVAHAFNRRYAEEHPTTRTATSAPPVPPPSDPVPPPERVPGKMELDDSMVASMEDHAARVTADSLDPNFRPVSMHGWIGTVTQLRNDVIILAQFVRRFGGPAEIRRSVVHHLIRRLERNPQSDPLRDFDSSDRRRIVDLGLATVEGEGVHRKYLLTRATVMAMNREDSDA